jgi:hypothetical protein
MAELFLVFSIMFGIISLLILGVASGQSPHSSIDRMIAKVSGSVFLLCVTIGVWSGKAIADYSPTVTVVERPIEELRNVPFYFDENDKPVEIKGDGRFADPKTTVVLLKTISGGWKYGLYVTESRRVEFAKKVAVEK